MCVVCVGQVPPTDVVPMEEEEYMGNAFITNQYSHVLQNLGFSHW